MACEEGGLGVSNRGEGRFGHVRRGLHGADTYNLSEDPLTLAHRPSIGRLLNKRNRVFG